ncbi:uncharacterized protein LOC109826902 [Asparagus officinalis]|uniref:uncharacterized protein LOC109826902 n=1 Tax=Asparagus officinalis TaxID=4686 RepID=UPI00098E7A3A|nr:uncharacterized protein LOC109826902 [Asparagus officinalis]
MSPQLVYYHLLHSLHTLPPLELRLMCFDMSNLPKFGLGGAEEGEEEAVESREPALMAPVLSRYHRDLEFSAMVNALSRVVAGEPDPAFSSSGSSQSSSSSGLRMARGEVGYGLQRYYQAGGHGFGGGGGYGGGEGSSSFSIAGSSRVGKLDVSSTHEFNFVECPRAVHWRVPLNDSRGFDIHDPRDRGGDRVPSPNPIKDYSLGRR